MRILALLFLSLFTMNSAADERNQKQSVDSLFDYACAYTEMFYGYDCEGLDAPMAITSKVVPSLYYGFYYKGEDYVFISPRVSARQWNSTVVHETVHYILDHQESGFSRCESEEAARYTHHSYEGTEYDASWKKRYRCEGGLG